MGETNKDASAEVQHKDAARTTTESGAAAAAGLHSTQPEAEVQADDNRTPRKVNAGSSDR